MIDRFCPEPILFHTGQPLLSLINNCSAPSSEVLQEFSMEPDMAKWMAWNTSEIKLAMSLEESMKLLK